MVNLICSFIFDILANNFVRELNLVEMWKYKAIVLRLKPKAWMDHFAVFHNFVHNLVTKHLEMTVRKYFPWSPWSLLHLWCLGPLKRGQWQTDTKNRWKFSCSSSGWPVWVYNLLWSSSAEVNHVQRVQKMEQSAELWSFLLLFLWSLKLQTLDWSKHLEKNSGTFFRCVR